MRAIQFDQADDCNRLKQLICVTSHLYIYISPSVTNVVVHSSQGCFPNHPVACMWIIFSFYFLLVLNSSPSCRVVGVSALMQRQLPSSWRCSGTILGIVLGMLLSLPFHSRSGMCWTCASHLSIKCHSAGFAFFSLWCTGLCWEAEVHVGGQ